MTTTATTGPLFPVNHSPPLPKNIEKNTTVLGRPRKKIWKQKNHIAVYARRPLPPHVTPVLSCVIPPAARPPVEWLGPSTRTAGWSDVCSPVIDTWYTLARPSSPTLPRARVYNIKFTRRARSHPDSCSGRYRRSCAKCTYPRPFDLCRDRARRCCGDDRECKISALHSDPSQNNIISCIRIARLNIYIERFEKQRQDRKFDYIGQSDVYYRWVVTRGRVANIKGYRARDIAPAKVGWKTDVPLWCVCGGFVHTIILTFISIYFVRI